MLKIPLLTQPIPVWRAHKRWLWFCLRDGFLMTVKFSYRETVEIRSRFPADTIRITGTVLKYQSIAQLQDVLSKQTKGLQVTTSEGKRYTTPFQHNIFEEDK